MGEFVGVLDFRSLREWGVTPGRSSSRFMVFGCLCCFDFNRGYVIESSITLVSMSVKSYGESMYLPNESSKFVLLKGIISINAKQPSSEPLQ